MKIGELFRKDHERLDSVIKGFRKSLESGTPDKEYLSQLIQGLHRHIYWEEELLFPLAKPYTADEAIIEEFNTDHGLIWNNLAELEAGVAQGLPPGRLELILDEMGDVLEAHNVDEEHQIYARVDEVCDARTAAEFVARVEKADVPQGWRCATHWG